MFKQIDGPFFVKQKDKPFFAKQIDGFEDSPVVFHKTNRTEITCDLLYFVLLFSLSFEVSYSYLLKSLIR